MGNIFNDDFRDFINALNKNNVRYILVGGYAVILHGYRRTTGDLDLWVQSGEENYKKLTLACHEFGLALLDMTKENFLNNDELDVFSFGVPPVSIDIMKSVKGCDFDEAFEKSIIYDDSDLQVRFIHISTLIQAKKASGRYKDLDDIEKLAGF